MTVTARTNAYFGRYRARISMAVIELFAIIMVFSQRTRESLHLGGCATDLSCENGIKIRVTQAAFRKQRLHARRWIATLGKWRYAPFYETTHDL